MEGASLPHQSPLPAILPVLSLRRIERAALALDLDEPGDSGGIMARQLDSAVCEYPATPLIDAEVVSNYPVPILVGMTAFRPLIDDLPDVVVQAREGALGHRIAVIVAPPADHRCQLHDHLGLRQLPIIAEEGRQPPAMQGDFFLLGADQQLAVWKEPEIEAEKVEPTVDVNDAGLGVAQLQPAAAEKLGQLRDHMSFEHLPRGGGYHEVIGIPNEVDTSVGTPP